MMKPVVVALAAFVLGGICQRAFTEAEPAARSYESHSASLELIR